jgi:hypothetical protein
MTGLVILGGYFAVTRDHGRRLNEHDVVHREIEKHDAAQDVALATLQAWQDGYSAARERYDRQTKTQT